MLKSFYKNTIFAGVFILVICLPILVVKFRPLYGISVSEKFDLSELLPELKKSETFTAISFGYNTCGLTCPAQKAALIQISENQKINLNSIFVVQEDNANSNKNYNHPGLVVLKLNAERITSLNEIMKKKIFGHDPSKHDSSIYIFDQTGRLVLFYPFLFPDIKKILNDIEEQLL